MQRVVKNAAVTIHIFAYTDHMWIHPIVPNAVTAHSVQPRNAISEFRIRAMPTAVRNVVRATILRTVCGTVLSKTPRIVPHVVTVHHAPHHPVTKPQTIGTVAESVVPPVPSMEPPGTRTDACSAAAAVADD